MGVTTNMSQRMVRRPVQLPAPVTFNMSQLALEWFGKLGYAVGHGPHLAPGEPAAERDSFGEAVLVGHLREAIPAILKGHATILPERTSGELSVAAAAS